MRDGHRVVDRRSVEAVALLVEALEEVGQLGDDAPGPARAAQTVCVRPREERLVRHVEADHRQVDPASEHRRRSLRVDERVELRCRRDVALRDRAAHPHDAVDVHAALDEAGDVRQRSRRHEHDAGLEPVGRVDVGRRRGRLRQVRTVQSALTVHVRGGAQGPPEWRSGASHDWDVRAAGELEHLERVARRLVHRLVACDRDDAAQLHLR